MGIKRILVASSNEKKLKEIEKILSPLGMEVVKPPEKLEVKEWANTFIGNAHLKAKAYYERFKIPALADDSGLVVESIAPLPGVYSARFHKLFEFGQEPVKTTEDEANIAKLLRVLKGKKNRRAKFISAALLYAGEGKMLAAEGEVRGFIAERPRGDKGFGYDPIFIPEGFDKTFAEMSPEEKNSISHRARALKRLAELLSCVSNL
jgi:XTP/dITP diphosphohydrolase